jgi:hypothetical protein
MSKIVHFEIPVDDPDRATAFYRDVLGWEITRFGEEPYLLVQAGSDDEPGANGALCLRDELHRGPVVIAAVDDVGAALARARDGGAQVLQDTTAVPGVGWSAYVRDPEGNALGLFQDDPAAAVG